MKNFNQPRFITFEGIEGSGKSTQSKKLYKYLLAQNVKVIHTREVGGTPEAEEIRNILVHRELYPVSELMLVMAARYEHTYKLILPALQDGYWVICDRFVDSTACYQSRVEGMSIDDIFSLHSQLIQDGTGKPVMPDLTFLMDIPPRIGLARSLKTKDVNKFEAKDMGFHRNIYEKFKNIARLNSKRIKVINCRSSKLQEIHKEIVNTLLQNLS